MEIVDRKIHPIDWTGSNVVVRIGLENGAMTHVIESPIAPTTVMSLGRRRCTEVAVTAVTQVEPAHEVSM